MADSLIPERPLVFSPTLAASIGLEQAILLQHLQGLQQWPASEMAGGDYLWFDRRPHPHTVLPATAVTKDDAEALGHWLDAALRPHLQRGLHSVDKRAKVA